MSEPSQTDAMSEKIEKLMTHLSVTRKGAQRIAEIVEAGVEILLEEGFTALTKRRIAKRLGIGHGNVSYYFPTREALWQAVIEYELKAYYDKHYQAFESDPDDAQGCFDEFVRFWFEEYEDREMRIFFAQVLAFAEVKDVVAKQRDAIYEMFFEESLSRMRPLTLGVSEEVLRERAMFLMATLEGMHAVTAFRPELVHDNAKFKKRVVEHMNAIVRGKL